MTRFVFFDCDSTLSAIEGIDELARLRGDALFAVVSQMTRDAMSGGVPLEEIFARRLELIRPTQAEMDSVGALYVEKIEPDAAKTLSSLRQAGWTPVIISGGFRQAIRPLAAHLGIDRIEAVDVFFNADGSYRDFDRDYPTTRVRGKNEVISAIKAACRPTQVVMVGDGASDLETAPDVDLFVGFGGYAVREKVKAGAQAFIYGMNELPALLLSREI
ncbi:MAG: HAD-IB family phosphatase [Puniceicoccales bacterium]|nr:HAD-IB family phosphatase [Puniceicoccales bacterium]